MDPLPRLVYRPRPYWDPHRPQAPSRPTTIPLDEDQVIYRAQRWARARRELREANATLQAQHQEDATALADLVRYQGDRERIMNRALSMGRTEKGQIFKFLIKSTTDPDERMMLRHAASTMEPEERASALKRLFRSTEHDLEVRELRAELYATARRLSAERKSYYLQVLAHHPLDRAERALILDASLRLPMAVRRAPIERLAETVDDAQELDALHAAAYDLPDGEGAVALLRLVQRSETAEPGVEQDVDGLVPISASKRLTLRSDTAFAALKIPSGRPGKNTVQIFHDLIEWADNDDEKNLTLAILAWNRPERRR